MKLYKVTSWNMEIEPIEITRKSDSSFWSIGHRGKEQKHALITSYYNHFETVEAAKNYIVEREFKKVISYKKALLDAEKEYEKAKLL